MNGGYGAWSAWSGCDCDDTEETRTRDCDDPVPINDGYTCTEQGLGDASETRLCDVCTTEDMADSGTTALCESKQ